MGDATGMLKRIAGGEVSAANELLPLIEHELREIAGRHMRGESPGHTFQTTLLVNEAYVRLIRQQDVTWRSRSHFYAIASHIIRRILVDHARTRNAAKRGGDWTPVSLNGSAIAETDTGVDLLELEDALNKLADLDERQARVVELRFFGGLGVEDAAEALGVSPRTVESDWHMARAWLRRELQ